ncbi:SDR family oxidoreductase [Edwardsiella piscicida]|uniref:SDR family oxidoreductase n=1 Tax=Edwardsiella piscicida TaxID=1263550 RepID=UPI001CEC9954|nr:SDR family oxidoreductase [Edwardsiella piscicida]AOP43951.2 SDR family oxidoreductase [Edwardsiella piscicida]
MQKAILITGCSSGIGLAAAKDLHQRGYRVLAACRKAEDVAAMEAMGMEGITLDLDNAESVEQAARQVLALTDGRLYALFNNGGFGLYGPLSQISREELERQFATNLFGTHQLTQLLLPAMLAQGEGRIIQTSSIMGVVATPGRGAYAASKYALEGWSDALRMELRGGGVHVSLIEPGPIRSRFTHNVHQCDSAKPVTNPGIAARFTLTPEAVLPKLRHALESPRPRLRYPVTVIAHALSLLRRILPGRALDRILSGHSTAR